MRLLHKSEKTRETQTRHELSWGEAIWGGTNQPTDKESYRGAMLVPENFLRIFSPNR
jgi:hypothetical protein